ncbi:hypothetical protein QUT12_22570, partial [Xanthomonas citri pv. citri]
VGEMLEQLREADEALPVGQILRQHLGRERLPDDGHRERLFENGFSDFSKKYLFFQEVLVFPRSTWRSPNLVAPEMIAR